MNENQKLTGIHRLINFNIWLFEAVITIISYIWSQCRLCLPHITSNHRILRAGSSSRTPLVSLTINVSIISLSILMYYFPHHKIMAIELIVWASALLNLFCLSEDYKNLLLFLPQTKLAFKLLFKDTFFVTDWNKLALSYLWFAKGQGCRSASAGASCTTGEDRKQQWDSSRYPAQMMIPSGILSSCWSIRTHGPE